MFGITPKLSDSQLYLLHDMVENILSSAEETLAQLPKDNIQEIAALALKIAYYKQELADFEKTITELRQQHFQFSVEELYYMYGQYDKFIGIEFHKLSESAKKYGRNIGGILVYGKTERKLLEEVINSGNIPRTNGLVKIDVSSTYPLSNEQIKELLETGFLSGDIHEILNSNTPLVNSYAQTGRKEIPNTIELKFDPTGMDPCKFTLFNLNTRLRLGLPLILSDWYKYYGYNLYYTPELKQEASIQQEIYTPEGVLKSEVRFYELTAKQYNTGLNTDERTEFITLLRGRKVERLELLKEELKKNNITSLESFKQAHPAIYMEIYKTAIVFEDEVLSINNFPIPVYWDFRTYLHIFLRHCDELQPDGHFKKKTKFAYSQRDIRRVLKIAVENLETRIQDRLSQGLDFRSFGEKALYFNGNYYSMRIEANGRIDSFYPNEN